MKLVDYELHSLIERERERERGERGGEGRRERRKKWKEDELFANHLIVSSLENDLNVN